MRKLFQVILRFAHVIVFVILGIAAFNLVAVYHNYHKFTLSKVNTVISASFYQQLDYVHDYFHLAEANKQLREENVDLRNKMENCLVKSDSCKAGYSYISAEVIENSVKLTNNFFMLNRGSKQGIEKEMTVITSKGIAGIVQETTENFSLALSVLNSNFRLSGKVKKNGAMGSLMWDGKYYDKILLKDVPAHYDIADGDTVISYSPDFPEGTLVGFIKDFSKNNDDGFYTITLKLATDFNKLHNVYVVNNLLKQEQMLLKNKR
jgi:rod shape-determining protein MreC